MQTPSHSVCAIEEKNHCQNLRFTGDRSGWQPPVKRFMSRKWIKQRRASCRPLMKVDFVRLVRVLLILVGKTSWMPCDGQKLDGTADDNGDISACANGAHQMWLKVYQCGSCDGWKSPPNGRPLPGLSCLTVALWPWRAFCGPNSLDLWVRSVGPKNSSGCLFVAWQRLKQHMVPTDCCFPS